MNPQATVEIEAGSCPSCNGTGDLGGNPSYGMCPDCDGTGKFPPATTSPTPAAEGIVERLTERRMVNLTDIVQMRALLDEYSVLHHEAASVISSLTAERDAARDIRSLKGVPTP